MNNRPLLDVRRLVKHFPVRSGWLRSSRQAVRAVDDVSFTIESGQTLGLVGESGCGKSTTGRLILRLIEATSGQIFFAGQDIRGMDGKQMRKLRRQMQMVFQDPYAFLNPRLRIGESIAEPLKIHGIAKGKRLKAQVIELLEVVGLDPAYAKKFPHEFSGGQRQRIGIARALALRPQLIVCDEPVSALDVSIQAQVINLLQDLQHQFGLTYLFIAHDLAVVRHISDRVAVMYLGRLMEVGEKNKLYENPLHPYTQALLRAVPQPVPGAHAERVVLKGDVPSPMEPPTGCRFHTRCPHVMPVCKRQEPQLLERGEDHKAACHLLD